MEILIILISLIATFVGSISGIGGGVLIKPVLDAVSDMSSSQISFLSGTTVLTMTVVSLLKTRDIKSKVDIRTFFLGLGSALGGIAGKNIFSIIKAAASNDALVGLVQNIVMVFLTVTVFVYTIKKGSIKTLDIRNRSVTFFAGLLLGILSSFLGIGGGPINLMVLSYLFSMDSRTSALNSLFTIFMSQTLSFTISAVEGIPDISIRLLLMMCLMGVIGATTGRTLSKRMSNKAVDKLFLALMFVIICLSVYNCIVFYQRGTFKTPF